MKDDLKYQLVGKHLAETNEELFDALLKQIGYEEPVMFDYDQIPALVEPFCNTLEITKAEMVGKLYDRDATRYKNYFTAVVVKLYCPLVLNNPNLRLPNGLMAAIGRALGVYGRKKLGFLRMSLFYYRIYDDWRAIVDELYNIIVKHNNEQRNQELSGQSENLD